MKAIVWGALLAAVLAPGARADWKHQLSEKTLILNKTVTKTRAFASVVLTNTGNRVFGGGDAWSKGSAVKFGAGLGNWRITTSAWRPEPQDPVGEIEWYGDLEMWLRAEAKSGECAALVTARAQCRIIVDLAPVVDETIQHTAAIESEEDLITTLTVAPGGIGGQIPITIPTGHGVVELTDASPLPPGCRCGKSVLVIRKCYAFTHTQADGWWSTWFDVGRLAEAITDVEARVKDHVDYINTCGK